MSIEMEIPKVLWLKNNMPKELFDRCKFYDLTDALTHMATGNENRSFCSTVCKQGYVPVGVDGSVKGWQGDFLETIGLGDLVEDNFKRLGGVNGEVSSYHKFWMSRCADRQEWLIYERRRKVWYSERKSGIRAGLALWHCRGQRCY